MSALDVVLALAVAALLYGAFRMQKNRRGGCHGGNGKQGSCCGDCASCEGCSMKK